MEAENQRSEEENQSTTVTENENRCRYAHNNYLSPLRARSEEKKNEERPPTIADDEKMKTLCEGVA